MGPTDMKQKGPRHSRTPSESPKPLTCFTHSQTGTEFSTELLDAGERAGRPLLCALATSAAVARSLASTWTLVTLRFPIFYIRTRYVESWSKRFVKNTSEHATFRVSAHLSIVFFLLERAASYTESLPILYGVFSTQSIALNAELACRAVDGVVVVLARDGKRRRHRHHCEPVDRQELQSVRVGLRPTPFPSSQRNVARLVSQQETSIWVHELPTFPVTQSTYTFSKSQNVAPLASLPGLPLTLADRAVPVMPASLVAMPRNKA